MHLETEQQETLSKIVEAGRNVPTDEREPFLALLLEDQNNFTVTHKGLVGGSCHVYSSDLWELDRQGLIAMRVISHNAAYQFDVRPEGLAYYREMKLREGMVLESVEAEVNHYLDAEHFQNHYPGAFQKFKNAQALLWDTDSESQLTTIGHLCREALQEFATVLVHKYQPPDVDENKARDINRILSVIKHRSDDLGESKEDLLRAAFGFWRAASALVQRQEHGGHKEGEPLVWEDGRRVVFQTAILMYEIDRCLVQ